MFLSVLHVYLVIKKGSVNKINIRYRHVVERISKSCALSETQVTQKIIELTKQNKENDPYAKEKNASGTILLIKD